MNNKERDISLYSPCMAEIKKVEWVLEDEGIKKPIIPFDLTEPKSEEDNIITKEFVDKLEKYIKEMNAYKIKFEAKKKEMQK